MTRWRSFTISVVVLGLGLLATTVSPLTGQWLEGAGASLDLPPLDAAIPSPADVLGHPLGSRFHDQSEILRYLETLAGASNRVRMWHYATTYEGRPLVLLAIASPTHLRRLERVRDEHHKAVAQGAAPQRRQRWLDQAPVVVWLGYGIHGNEPSSTEAAVALSYVLAAGQGKVAQDLERTVVIVDPLSNPDGRERYVHRYRARRGNRANPDPAAAEHREPWPGGRYNHYLVDLNRDWAWASQRETRARLEVYRRWEPQVSVDFHEMSRESSYFFPPPAEPIHPAIDERVLRWLKVFGEANAGAFDRLGWSHYAEEHFDLFYPGYGDSYPSLRGAVGMTYEAAGGGRAGEQIRLKDGQLLTLADRIARHLVTSLATVATAAEHRGELLSDFVASRRAAAGESPQTYLWDADQAEARPLAELLTRHGVRVTELARDAHYLATATTGKTPQRRRFAQGTFAVSTRQPLGNLVRSLLDLEAPMPTVYLQEQRRRIENRRTATFYDVTAWSLPLAFNLETWVVAREVQESRPLSQGSWGLVGQGKAAFLMPPQGVAGYRLIAGLLRAGIEARVSPVKLRQSGRDFPAGTLVIPTGGQAEELGPAVHELARESRVTLHRSDVAPCTREPCSDAPTLALARRRLALVRGSGVNPTSFGFLWHLLDQDVGVDVSPVLLSELEDVDLSSFDVLILPHLTSGGPRPGGRLVEELRPWLRGGGVLVAVGGAVTWLQEHGISATETVPEPASSRRRHASRRGPERRGSGIPGAALRTEMETLAALTLGLQRPPPVLFSGTRVLKPTGDAHVDVLRAAQDPVVSGFVWPEARERLRGALLVSQERFGRGRVILFSQDPTFRLFWRGTAPLFLNALLLDAPFLGPREPRGVDR